ncbi:MAG TPA: hemolysin family protein [Gammaproteobacteria bacterium]|nr:hemolysin family protein [Gammaproteobacteria bacterium]
MINFFWILIAATLILLNAFFVAAEFGMVKIRQTRIAVIKKKYGIRGKILFEINRHLDAYLSACQVGITFASLGLGWVGEPAFAYLIEPVFHGIGIFSQATIHASALTTAFILISFLHIVVGELLPKSIAIRQSESVSIWTALPLYGFYWLMYPVIWLVNACSNIFLRLLQFSGKRTGDHFYSIDEIKLILSSTYLHGNLTKYEKKILEHTLDLGDLKVIDVMRPADEMVMINTKQSTQDALNIINQYQYSRYPVYEDQLHIVIGIIHVKDIFSQLYKKIEIINLKNIMRPVLKVSRRLPVLELMRKFREGMPHFAIVYSGRDDNIIGFVTLDNLLHILLGRIKDEFHHTRDDWIKNEDGSFNLPGNASIYTLERAINVDIEQEEIDDEIDTLGGLIISRLETLPTVGQEIEFKQFIAIVEKMRGPRIVRIQVYNKQGN